MADGEFAVGRCIAGAEARSAERFAEDSAGRNQVSDGAVGRQRLVCRHGIGIDRKLEFIVADIVSCKDLRGGDDVFIDTARAAGDDALVNPDIAVFINLGEQVDFRLAAKLAVGSVLGFPEILCRIFLQLINRQRVARMHRQRDHGLDFGKVAFNPGIVIRAVLDAQLLIIILTAPDFIVGLCLFIGFPDGAPACGLGCHDVDAVAEVLGQVRDAGAGEFKRLVFDKTGGIGGADQGQGHVMGTDTGFRRAGQPDQDCLGLCHVIGAADQLLGQFAAAFADSHRAEGAISCVGVGAENHIAALCHHFTVVGMNDRVAWRNVDAAVLLRRGERELVVIFIDCAADRAQGIVAVGQDIGHREFLHSGRAGCLDNADIGDVMAGQGIEPDMEQVLIGMAIMGIQDAVNNRLFLSLFDIEISGNRGRNMVDQYCRFVVKVHKYILSSSHSADFRNILHDLVYRDYILKS